MHVLVVEDDYDLREAVAEILSTAGYKTLLAESEQQAMRIIMKNNISMVVSDIRIKNGYGTNLLNTIKNYNPDLPVALMTAYGNVQQAVEAIKNGAVDYLIKPFESKDLIQLVGNHAIDFSNNESGFIAVDVKTKKLAEIAKKVAMTDATLMITGESGTGKEVIAQYVHAQSKRKDGPFVAINCAAIPDNMLEATLFGYEKGAFTGAYSSMPGTFEKAQGGTILLDEISEMDLSLQAKILRVLQEREVERLAGKQLIKLDVRVLATSNRNLKKEVQEGRFREDLYYRLNVFPLCVPPLRDRTADILPIAYSLLKKYSDGTGKKFNESAEKKLIEYPWPGNIRELDNVVQRACILSTTEFINEDDVDFGEYQMAEDKTSDTSKKKSLKGEQYKLIESVLNELNGNRKEAAKRLGVSERTLRYKISQMKDLGYEV